jgi:hypothetical protein
MPIAAEFLVALIFSSNRSQPEGSSTQTNGQERRSRIRQPLNDVEAMLAAFRRPRARPGLRSCSFAWHATFPPGTFVPPHIHPTQEEFIYMFEG